MAGVPRDRITIDLAEIGPALRARSQARHLTVAATARSVLALALQSSVRAPTGGPDRELGLDANHTEKVTVRMRRGAAIRLATRARVAGLSYGAYLTTLLDGTPATPLAPGHDRAVAALGISTEQLAVIAADINELIRRIGREGVLAAPQFSELLDTLACNVRRHLVLASRLMASLQPIARLRQRSGTRPEQRLPVP